MTDSYLSGYPKGTTLRIVPGLSTALYSHCQESSDERGFPASVPQPDVPMSDTNSAGMLCKLQKQITVKKN